MRGRKPKPVTIHESNGNPSKISKRELAARSAAKPPLGAMGCPDWLTAEGRQVWESVVPLLQAMGTAGVVDVQALGRYCDAVVLWQRAQAFLHLNGSTYPLRTRDAVVVEKPDGKGGVRLEKTNPVIGVCQFPQVAEYRQLSKLLLSFESEFGMTAAGRSRVEVYPSAFGGAESAEQTARRRFFDVGDPIPFRPA